MRVKKDQISLEFVSDLKFTDFSVMVLNYLKNLLNIDEETFFKIEISLREIINNAVLHGNRNDLNKHVFVQFKWNKSLLRIRVKDESNRLLNLDKINGAIEKKDLLSSSGRGLLIVKNYMDLVDFLPSKKGTEVVIEKQI